MMPRSRPSEALAAGFDRSHRQVAQGVSMGEIKAGRLFDDRRTHPEEKIRQLLRKPLQLGLPVCALGDLMLNLGW